MKLLPLVFALTVVAPGCAHAQSVANHKVGPCTKHGTSIVIDLDRHDLWLCESNVAAAEYGISIGKGGVGKRKRGDNKTPVGTYELGKPRSSKKFGIFIPVGYPTTRQRVSGYTGGAIGIHGPDRSFTWAGWLNTVTDWTQGCVAVKSDEAIKEIAGWLKSKRSTRVHILAEADER